jgi:hypothetical protein
MPNNLGNYDEDFFAQEALIQLEKALGFASRVYRGYDPTVQQKGSTIQIRRPGTFTAQDEPSSIQDLNTDSLSINLDTWKGVRFGLNDKDLTLSAPQIITDHIRPAAYALADKIDLALAAIYKQLPNYYLAATPFTLNDIADARAAATDLLWPLEDSENLFFGVTGATEAAILKGLAASGMQPNQQDVAVRRGTMGRLFDFEMFQNQNMPTHTSGVSADFTGTVDGANAIGVSSILASGFTAGITYKAGDSFSIAGDAQRYVISTDGTDADGNAATLAFTPALKQATVGAEVLTFYLGGASKRQNLMFHRNFAALAMAPLSTMGASFGGTRMSSISDPKTQLALRVRMWYDQTNSKVVVALDALFGVKLLDPQLALRVVQA